MLPVANRYHSAVSGNTSMRIVITGGAGFLAQRLAAAILARETLSDDSGLQQPIAELLISDMTRKGFIDGRSLRLPTVTVRPGKPNRAASSFASGIIREPLSGVDASCPVAPTTRMWVQSPRTVIANLLIGHEAPARAFAHTRSINVPGICVGVGEMVNALRAVAGDAVADRVKWNHDPAIDRIVATWAPNFAPKLGPALGMKSDSDFANIIRAYT